MKRVNKVLSKFNLQLIRKIPYIEFKLKQPWYQSFNFQHIIDIGANTGQFSEAAIKAFPNSIIYAFEPISEEYNLLNRKFKEKPNFIAVNKGVGETYSTEEITINKFSPVSSIMEMTQKHKEYFPQSEEISYKQEIEIIKLDDYFKDKKINNAMLKIDVQGYEDKVIKGASSTLNFVNLVIVETSFRELYKGQPLFDDIYHLLQNKHFNFYGCLHELVAGENQEPVQIDAVFINSKINRKK